MGYNPYRKHEVKPIDFVFLGAAVAVAIGLVIWGFFG